MSKISATTIHVAKIASKRLAAMQKYATQISLDDDAENIHQLRVNFKKLRAFLRLAHLQHSKAEIPQKLKRLYHLNGQLGDLQLFDKKLSSHSRDVSLDAPRATVAQKMQAAKQALISNIEAFSFKKCQTKMLHRLPGKLRIHTLKKYLSVVGKKIKKSVHNTLTDEHLHSTRKILKDLLYNYKVIDKVIGVPGQFLTSRSELKKLVFLLGKYQDTRMCRSLLRSVFFDELAGNGTLLKIDKRWSEQKRKMKVLVIKRLGRDFLKH